MQNHDNHGLNREDMNEEYDLVVEGTGLIESIVACAAAKCGKSILHLDYNDYYGRNSATFPLGEFLEWSREHKGTRFDDQSMKTIELKDGSPLLRIIDFQDIDSPSTVINVGRSSSKMFHTACNGYMMELLPSTLDSTTVYSDSIHPAFFGYVSDHRATAVRALSQSRKFMIDLDSRVLFSAGKAVNCLVNSGVANYLEFKSIEKLLYRSEGDFKLYAVPCSKNEVFKDKLLGPLEKRNLTRFLQFAVDWGRVNIDKSEVSTLNERVLAIGGSLHRPQNKAYIQQGSSLLAPTYNVHGYEKELFTMFLSNCLISQKLQKIIIHALCMHPILEHNGPFGDENNCKSDNSFNENNDIDDDGGDSNGPKDSNHSSDFSTITAMTQLYAHINALGHYGSTGFIHPLYGFGELPQAFCRMCAVWGGTYMLRRTVSALHIGFKEDDVKISDCSSATVNLDLKDNNDNIGDDINNNDNSDDNNFDKSNNGKTITHQDVNVIDVIYHDKENYALESLSINDIKESQEPQFLIGNNDDNVLQPLPIDKTENDLQPLIVTVEDPTLKTTTQYKCKAFLTNSDSPSSVFSFDNVHRYSPVISSSLTSRVLICVNKVDEIKGGKPGEGCMLLPLSRSISIIPPNSKDINNKNAIYILQLDSLSLVCPDGYHLIYLTTEVPTSKIGASDWDKFVNDNSSTLCGEFDRVIEAVISSNSTSFFSSLSTAVTASSSPYDEPSEEPEVPPIPPSASSLDLFLSSTPSIPTSSPSFLLPPSDPTRNPDNPYNSNNPINDTIQIISSTTTIRPLYQATSNIENLPSNIAVSYDTTSTIHCEEQFVQAESIFNRLFPTETFFLPIISENEDDEENI